MHEWVEIFNHEMSRTKEFSPISPRSMTRVQSTLESKGVLLKIGYFNKRPSAICSYSFNSSSSTTRIIDFYVLSEFQKGGMHLIDMILEESRRKGMSRIEAWIPLQLSSALEILGEFLFSPEEGAVRMKCGLMENDVDSKTEIIEDGHANNKEPLLPFVEPLKIDAILKGMSGAWFKAKRIQDTSGRTYCDIFMSNKERQNSWIFPHITEGNLSSDFVGAVLTSLYDSGIRFVETEIDIGHKKRGAFDEWGFDAVHSSFKMTCSLEF